jgi:outer membrane protein assembly factor BamA
MGRGIIFIFLFLISVCFSDEKPPDDHWVNDNSLTLKLPEINDDASTKISNGISVFPIVGYDPSTGFYFGGAFFHGDTEPPVKNLSIYAYGAFTGLLALDVRFKIWNTTNLFYNFSSLTTNFFDPYFGEGNNTTPQVAFPLNNFKTNLKVSAWYRFTRLLSSGIYTELNYRKENGVNGDSTLRIFGDEFTPIVGLALVYDSRDHEFFTKHGCYLTGKVDWGPAFLSTGASAKDFVRFQAEGRFFVSFFSNLVWGSELRLGTAIGSPGYLYRYALGGSLDMRGYQINRLRGQHFYEAQTELRIDILSWFGVVGFFAVGDTANISFSDFMKPKLTEGFGLRFGLPPDFVAKVRMDLGFSQDEWAFYLNFNEAF